MIDSMIDTPSPISLVDVAALELMIDLASLGLAADEIDWHPDDVRELAPTRPSDHALLDRA